MLRLFASRPRYMALLGIALGVLSSLRAQEDLPPEFLRAHALVVRFLASAFDDQDGDSPAKDQAPLAANGAPASPAQAAPAPGPSGNGGALAAPGSGAAAAAQGDTVSTRPPAAAQLPPSWTTGARRYTVTGAPVAIRLSGEGLVIVVQVTPYDRGKGGLLVVAQGQVWLRGPDGRISYHSAFESLSVGFGEPLYFFPLGLRPDGTTPIKVQIAVDHFGDPPSIPETEEAPAAGPRK